MAQKGPSPKHSGHVVVEATGVELEGTRNRQSDCFPEDSYGAS